MSIVRADAIEDSAGGNTATVNGIPLRPGVLDPENRIINGAFDFWRRGTSLTTIGYCADRWTNSPSGGTVTMSQQSFALGDTLGDNNPAYFLRQTVTGQTLASHYAVITQPIEGVRTYAGKTITVLGWARRSSGAGNMAISFDQYFGTGGSPSAVVEGSGQSIPLTGSFQPFAATFSIPSITGKALGTNGNDNLLLIFWTSAGSNFNARSASLGLQTIGVDLWGIHIKVGTHTTAAVDLYRQPERGPELARCNRYYQEIGSQAANEFVYTNYFGGAGNTHYLPIPLPVTMRAAPSAAVVGTWTLTNISIFTVTASALAFRLNVTCVSAGAGTIQNVNAGTKLTFDAEF